MVETSVMKEFRIEASNLHEQLQLFSTITIVISRK